jgi:hypothetical protein
MGADFSDSLKIAVRHNEYSVESTLAFAGVAEDPDFTIEVEP